MISMGTSLSTKKAFGATISMWITDITPMRKESPLVELNAYFLTLLPYRPIIVE